MRALTAQVADRSDFGVSNHSFVRFIDRWIYVFMAALFIGVVLLGFVPDSVGKLAAIKAGQRPPFPIIAHVHAVLMGSFLLLLLVQTFLMAVGRKAFHQTLGVVSFLLVPAIVVAGFILVPTIYHTLAGAIAAAPPEVKPLIAKDLHGYENIMLLQTRIGLLFSLFIFIGLSARKADPGLHRRMMILAVAPALAASYDRMEWLPSTFPLSPLGSDAYVILSIMPLLIWDLWRSRSVHKAYLLWLIGFIAVSLPLYYLWDSPAWHAFAPHYVGM